MIERRPLLDLFTHFVLLLGVLVIASPLYITFVASTQTTAEVARAPMSLLPGEHFFENYKTALSGADDGSMPPECGMLWESTVMPLAIAIGKLVLAMFS